MFGSPLFDQTHIVKVVPVDADIELRCKRCGTLFKTKNAYHIGYSEIHKIYPKDDCNHDVMNLVPTNTWFPTKDIHKETADESWASLFDHSHIVDGVPIDADRELQCRRCNVNFQTKNTYCVGYSELFYSNPEEQEKCTHSLKDIIPTKIWFPDSGGRLI